MPKLSTRKLLDLANTLFTEERPLSLFNALAEMLDDMLPQELIEGAADPSEPPLPRVLAVLSATTEGVIYTYWVLGESVPDVGETLREASGPLRPTVRPDNMLLASAISASEERTVALLAISFDAAGRRIVRFYRHPQVDRAQAAAHLIEMMDAFTAMKSATETNNPN